MPNAQAEHRRNCNCKGGNPTPRFCLIVPRLSRSAGFRTRGWSPQGDLRRCLGSVRPDSLCSLALVLSLYARQARRLFFPILDLLSQRLTAGRPSPAILLQTRITRLVIASGRSGRLVRMSGGRVLICAISNCISESAFIGKSPASIWYMTTPNE